MRAQTNFMDTLKSGTMPNQFQLHCLEQKRTHNNQTLMTIASHRKNGLDRLSINEHQKRLIHV